MLNGRYITLNEVIQKWAQVNPAGLHEVDGNPDGCRNEHDVSSDLKVLVKRPLDGFVQEHPGQRVDEQHADAGGDYL